MSAHFPLTPALSLGEREKRFPFSDKFVPSFSEIIFENTLNIGQAQLVFVSSERTRAIFCLLG